MRRPVVRAQRPAGSVRADHSAALCLVLALSLALIPASGCSKSSSGADTPYERDATAAIVPGQWSAAIAAARQWAAQDPENPVPHFILSVSYAYVGTREQLMAEIPLAHGTPERLQRIREWAEGVARENPDSPCPQLLVGVSCEAAGEVSAAIRHYERAIAIDERFKQAHVALGNLFISNGEPDKALRAYSAVLTLFPRDAKAHGGIALVYIQKGDFARATLHMEKAVALDPESVDAWLNLAMAYQQQGLTDKARKAFLEVKRLDPMGEAGGIAEDQLEQPSP